jgi:hypothetical protein
MPRGYNIIDEAQLQGRLWSPAQMQTALWLDAADISTIVTTSGLVSQWTDKSGNARNASTTVRFPSILNNAFNGLTAINFTAAAATKLDTPNFSIAPSRQFCSFAVAFGASLLGGSTYRRIWVAKGVNPDSLSPGATYPEGYFGGGPNNGEAMQIAGGAGVTSPLVSGLSLTQPFILSGRFGTAGLAANVNSVAANGGMQSTLGGQSGSLSTTGIRIGSDVSTSSISSWNSWIGEIILTQDITFAQSQQIEGYLAWKWGLVNMLPANHPFINRPPLIGD